MKYIAIQNIDRIRTRGNLTMIGCHKISTTLDVDSSKKKKK